MRKSVLSIIGVGALLIAAGIYYLFNGQSFSAASIKASYWLEPEYRAIARDVGRNWIFDVQILVENDEPLFDSGSFDSDATLESIDKDISAVLARYGYEEKSPKGDELKGWSLGAGKEITLHRGHCNHCFILVCIKSQR